MGNNMIISQKTFPNSLSVAVAIALTTISFLGAAVPEGINVLQKEPSGNITNTTISLGSDEERKNQLLLYAGLACIGFIGALLLDPPVEEGENVMRKSQRKVRERVRDQMKVLLSDPLFLIIASF